MHNNKAIAGLAFQKELVCISVWYQLHTFHFRQKECTALEEMKKQIECLQAEMRKLVCENAELKTLKTTPVSKHS